MRKARRASATPSPSAATAAPSTPSWPARLPELVVGEDADLIEQLWQKLWWALHYGGRGGPTVLAISAFDMALWDLKAKRAGPAAVAAARRLSTRACPAMPAASTSILPLDALLRQTDGNLERASAPSR